MTQHGPAQLRVATWNMAAKATPSHLAFLDALQADVLLLTEVPPSVAVDVRSTRTMALGQSHAALRGTTGLTLGIESSALGVAGGIAYISSVLPWRSMGGSQAENTARWVAEIDGSWPHEHPVVWGGDWNHELHGRMWAGCREGRAAILDLLTRKGLQCPTATLQTRRGDRSINHIAVPSSWSVSDPLTVPADGLSDHDAVVLECTVS